MIPKQKAGQALSVPAGIGAGVATAIAITLILAAIISWLISVEKLGEQFIGYGSLITLLVSSSAGSAVAIHAVKQKLAITSVLTGLIYYIILLSVTALFFEGQYQAMGVTLLVIAAGSIGVYLASLRGGKSKKHVNRKIRSW